MSAPPNRYITPEEYLELDRKAEYKSEYFDGEMFPMDGPRRPGEKLDPMAGIGEAHSLIVANVIASLNQQLRSSACRVYAHDMRLPMGAGGLFTCPDVMAVCGDRQFLDSTRDTLLNPTLIVEVLSPVTALEDLSRKFEHYRSIESLQHYVVVCADRLHADLYTREPDGRWLLTSANHMEDSLDLSYLGCALKASDLYHKVTL